MYTCNKCNYQTIEGGIVRLGKVNFGLVREAKDPVLEVLEVARVEVVEPYIARVVVVEAR